MNVRSELSVLQTDVYICRVLDVALDARHARPCGKTPGAFAVNRLLCCRGAWPPPSPLNETGDVHPLYLRVLRTYLWVVDPQGNSHTI